VSSSPRVIGPSRILVSAIATRRIFRWQQVPAGGENYAEAYPMKLARIRQSSVLSCILILATLAFLKDTGSLAQGRVEFANRVVGVTISHVYLPSPTTPGVVQIGNGPSDFPAGATDWTGWTPVSGTGFSAQLFAASGADSPVDSLAPALPVTSFGSGAFAGFVAPVNATLAGVPAGTLVATIQMRVWDNKGGTISDWSAAIAQSPGTEILGVSAPINVGPILGPSPPPRCWSACKAST
jgi:hypothetical protein